MKKIDIKKTKIPVYTTSSFNKSLKKAFKQGRDLNLLKEVIVKLANLEKLDKKYKDHELTDIRNYKNCRDCHIQNDWILIYRYENNQLQLTLLETGSHSELF